eukprot:4513580-Alexandrium_andersonii.AAC.1
MIAVASRAQLVARTRSSTSTATSSRRSLQRQPRTCNATGHSAKRQMLSDSVPDKSAVATDWKERVVKVQGAVAFVQEQGGQQHPEHLRASSPPRGIGGPSRSCAKL